MRISLQVKEWFLGCLFLTYDELTWSADILREYSQDSYGVEIIFEGTNSKV